MVWVPSVPRFRELRPLARMAEMVGAETHSVCLGVASWPATSGARWVTGGAGMNRLCASWVGSVPLHFAIEEGGAGWRLTACVEDPCGPRRRVSLLRR